MTGNPAFRLPVSMPPPTKAETAAIDRIVACWNEHLPRNRVRKLTPHRVTDCQAALRQFAADEICQAIEFYAGQQWQRTNQAWRTFDRWLDPQCILAWWEAAEEAAELRQRAERRAAATAGPAGPRKPGPPAPPRETYRDRKTRFDAMGGPDRYELLKRAKAALLADGVDVAKLTDKLVETKALELLSKATTADGSTPHGS